jgi:RimJ/RimL family protein N-acetyltransferase
MNAARHELNEMGQPIGRPVPNWKPPAWPPRDPMSGRYCRLEALATETHACDLFMANESDRDGAMWTYLPYGPFPDFGNYRRWIEEARALTDPLFFAIIEPGSNRAVGLASYLRIDPSAGSIEVGHLAYSPRLQRTPAATEAMYLMMERVFALGYRRYEWKCDALNGPSRAAALRLGFSFEGIFRQARVDKRGRNRDTAWFSIIDGEWPALRDSMVRWLSPDNFDAAGRQRRRLADFRSVERP